MGHLLLRTPDRVRTGATAALPGALATTRSDQASTSRDGPEPFPSG